MEIGKYIKEHSVAWAVITASVFAMSFSHKQGYLSYFNIPFSYAEAGISYLTEKLVKLVIGFSLLYPGLWVLNKIVLNDVNGRMGEVIMQPVLLIFGVYFIMLYFVVKRDPGNAIFIVLILVCLLFIFISASFLALTAHFYMATIGITTVIGLLIAFYVGLLEAATKCKFEVYKDYVVIDYSNGKALIATITKDGVISSQFTIIDTRQRALKFKVKTFAQPLKIGGSKRG